jgi:putative ABC transport system permease protein
MIKSFWRLQSVSPGFKPDNLLTLRIWLPSSRYAENHRQIAFFQQLINRIEKLPGVQSVGAIQDLPIQRNRMGYDFVIEGRPLPSSGDKSDAAYRVVTPDYFATMGIPLLSGRPFTGQDIQHSPPVVIINQSLARQFWPDGNSLGKRIQFGGEDTHSSAHKR